MGATNTGGAGVKHTPKAQAKANDRSFAALARLAAKLGLQGIETPGELVELFGTGRIPSVPAGLDAETFPRPSPPRRGAQGLPGGRQDPQRLVRVSEP